MSKQFNIENLISSNNIINLETKLYVEDLLIEGPSLSFINQVKSDKKSRSCETKINVPSNFLSASFNTFFDFMSK